MVEQREASRAAALEAARAHVGEADAERTTERAEVEGSRARVTIERDGLFDDSVQAVRHVLVLEREGEGEEWRVVDEDVTYRCRPGRGQQDFGPELCH